MTTTTRNNPPQPRPAARPPTLEQRLLLLRQFLFKAIAEGALAGIAGRVRPERLAKTFEIAAQRDPRLLDCAPDSMLAAFVEAAGVGLEPNTPLEHASLTAESAGNGRGLYADFQVTLRGLIVLAHRTGAVASVCARLVHAEEEFEVRYGTDEGITHTPIIGMDTRGPITAAYAVIRLRDEGLIFDVMSLADLEDIRRRWARNPSSGAWETDTGEMYKKTVLRRAMKWVPTDSDEMARAIRPPDVAPPPAGSRPEPVPADDPHQPAQAATP